MPTVSAIAVRRVFHHGRDSVTSYAAFSVVMIETIAPELDQMVTRKANVRMPPLFACDSLSASDRVMIFSTSVGANRPSIAHVRRSGSASGKKLATAISEEERGEEREEEVVGLLGGQVRMLSSRLLPRRSFDQFRRSSAALAGGPTCRAKKQSRCQQLRLPARLCTSRRPSQAWQPLVRPAPRVVDQKRKRGLTMIRMSAWTMALALAASTPGAAPRHAATKTVTWTGWFSDQQCARVRDGEVRPNNPDCVKKCLNDGAKAVFISEQARALFVVKDHPAVEDDVGHRLGDHRHRRRRREDDLSDVGEAPVRSPGDVRGAQGRRGHDESRFQNRRWHPASAGPRGF